MRIAASLIAAAAATVVGLGYGTSHAALYVEDFEDPQPTSEFTYLENVSDASVVNTGDPFATGTAGVNDYLSITDANASSYVAAAEFVAQPSGVLTATLRFVEPTRTGTGTEFAVRLGGSRLTTDIGPDVRLNDGVIQVSVGGDASGNGAATVNLVGSYTLDAAHTLRIDIDLANSQYSVLLDNVLLADATSDTTFAYRANDVTATSIDTITLTTFAAGANQQFLVDDVAVAVPEPAAVGLLGVGALIALSRRRLAWRAVDRPRMVQ